MKLNEVMRKKVLAIEENIDNLKYVVYLILLFVSCSFDSKSLATCFSVYYLIINQLCTSKSSCIIFDVQAAYVARCIDFSVVTFVLCIVVCLLFLL